MSGRADVLVSVHLGWWLLPTAITGASLIIALWMAKPSGRGDYAAIADGFVWLVIMMAALIVSLVAWLLWALFG
jgi:hypothetical protein